jgi:hypothetical protein
MSNDRSSGQPEAFCANCFIPRRRLHRSPETRPPAEIPSRPPQRSPGQAAGEGPLLKIWPKRVGVELEALRRRPSRLPKSRASPASRGTSRGKLAEGVHPHRALCAGDESLAADPPAVHSGGIFPGRGRCGPTAGARFLCPLWAVPGWPGYRYGPRLYAFHVLHGRFGHPHTGPRRVVDARSD